MKTRSLNLIIVFFACSLFLLYACNNSRPGIVSVDPAYARYVSGYTSGVVSNQQSIRVELAKPFLSDTSGKNPEVSGLLPDSMLEGIFEFEPEIEGKAIWVSSRVIEFVPDKPLTPAQFYTATFDLERVASVENEYEEFVFQFSAYPQVMNVFVDGLRSYGEFNNEWQKLTGSISTTDFADTANIKKCLNVKVNNREVPVKWSASYNNRDFYFYVDSIERKMEKGLVEVSWNGKSLNSLSSGKTDLVIPSMGDFTVTKINVMNDDDQSLELYFSAPILFNQNLKGIITVQDVNDLTYSITGSVVKVYLPQRVGGEKSIHVSTGIKNSNNFKMNEPYAASVIFQEPKPKVRLIGNGNILPNSGGLIFPFESISLKAVDVRVTKILETNVHQFLQVNELDGRDGLTRVGKIIIEKKIELDKDKKDLKQWQTHVIDLSKLITPDPGSIYRVSIKFQKEYAVCECDNSEGNANGEDGEMQGEQESSFEEEDKIWNERYWYDGSFDGGYDNWYYYDDENDNRSPCNSYYYQGKAVSRNIIASDLGMIYKLDDDKKAHAFISNMITTQPISGATVEYFDYARNLIAKGLTDANGMTEIKLKEKPFLMVASYGKQKGYMKLLDANTNSLSKFDVEGEVVQKGVKGFIYGERGVWRPGDSLYLSFMMEDKEKKLPPDYPVKFELHDPDGKIVYQVTKTKNVNNLYDFRTATGEEAVTGNYMAIARVGNRSFTKNVKIETIKPNRLKIHFEEYSQKKKNDTIGKISVKWLHGAIAKSLKTTVNVSLNEMTTQFNGYKGYRFDSPLRHYQSDATTIFDDRLDNQGTALIKTVLPAANTAPGMLRANFVTRVFEEGGDFSVDRFSTTYSPYTNYVGIQTPESKNYNNYLETNKSYSFDIVSVDYNGNPVNLKKVQVKIYKTHWRWWYEQGVEELNDYVAGNSAMVIQDTILQTVSGKARFNCYVKNEDYGRYIFTVNDVEGGHQAGNVLTFDWPYWSRGTNSGSENASMLSFSCDKTNYKVGEDIKLSFPSPSNGRALVSIETGKRVVQKFWISTTKGETRHTFKATAAMSPNAYVHVTLLQPHASTKNDLPIRMYGVVPVSVDDPNTHLKPVITTKDIWQPVSTASVSVKEEQGRSMTYTLAVVDEGLLDLTRFKTPEPWSTFYAREALGVKTWDMYDAVIGAFAGKLDKLISIGGDGDAMAGKGVKANRFKPMVKFIGPFTLAPGEQKTHKLDIPNYVGSVRIMVVAEDKGAYGNTEKAVSVRKPLMVLATLPRVLGPAETVQLPVDVFAMEKQVKNVKIEIETNDMLTVEGGVQQTITFKETGDEVVNFKLNVARKTGIAKVKIKATSGSEKAYQEIEIDVRVSNPKVVDSKDFTVAPGKDMSEVVSFMGITGTNRVVVEVSAIYPIGIEKRMDYLIQYPHGCIEQTTSSVFPQLFAINLSDISQSRRNEITTNVKAGLRRLQLFQTSMGGFAYWPGEADDSEWGSNYAGHFMLEAEKLGYSLPANMKTRWVKYQQQKAKNWVAGNSYYSHPHGSETYQQIQAYRLYVLALSNNPELGAMNRLREESGLAESARWRLAAAYQLIGQTEVALKLIEDLKITVPDYRELSYGYGSGFRDEAMILETLSIMKQKKRATPVFKSIMKKLGDENWMSTQETAYGLLSICRYVGIGTESEQIDFNLSADGGQGTRITGSKPVSRYIYTDKNLANGANLTLKNNGKSNLYVKVITEGTPLIGDQTSSAKGLTMKVKYKDMKGMEIQPDRLVQGTDFMAEVTLTNPGKINLEEMCLNQIFPSGWEIHNNRMDGHFESTNTARFQDIRDDRVYSYYNLLPSRTITITVKLNATYLGRFYLPTVYSEAMYDNTINARIPGRWIEVVKDEPLALLKK